MSYPVDSFIPKAARTLKGKKYQYIGKDRVPKFAFSPFTAEPRKTYNFFADVEVKEERESPASAKPDPRGGFVYPKSKFFTIRLGAFTYLEFRDWVHSGGFNERLELVSEYEWVGAEFVDYAFWRSKEKEPKDE